MGAAVMTGDYKGRLDCLLSAAVLPYYLMLLKTVTVKYEYPDTATLKAMCKNYSPVF